MRSDGWIIGCVGVGGCWMDDWVGEEFGE